MNTLLSRENAQFASFVLIILGLLSLVFTSHGLEIAPIFGFFSIWLMLISESFLLSRVQNTMQDSLEKLRKKQESEIQELLYFLRESKLGNNPWSSLDAAKNHIRKLGYPAIITDSGGACVSINAEMSDALGYGKELIGQLCHHLQTTASYGEYVQGIAANITNKKRFMHSRLVMVHADGTHCPGTVSIIMLPDMRTAVGIWFADSSGILKKC